MIDLTEQIAAAVKLEERTKDLDARDREYGGMRSLDIERAEEERARSMKGWTKPYSADVTRDDLKNARAPIDPRRITVGRLYMDAGRAVSRWAKKYRRDAAETLRTDATMLLLQWESQGVNPPLDLGGCDGLPLRRDWLTTVVDPDARAPRFELSPLAWKALHAAVKQAVSSPASRLLAKQQETEKLLDPDDIAAAAEQQQREEGAPTRLPDGAAPEVIAHAIGVTLNCARAIVARAYPAATPRDLSEQWRITRGTLDKALSVGAAELRKRYPDPDKLLTDLAKAGAAWRAETETSAILCLMDYRDGYLDKGAAWRAVLDWRGGSRGLDPNHLALLAAARIGLRRHGNAYGGELAERIALAIPRQINAERRRESRNLARGMTATVPSRAPIGETSDSRAPSGWHAQWRNPHPPRRLTAAERAEDYRLAAVTDRRNRGCSHDRASGRLRFNQSHELLAETVCEDCGATIAVLEDQTATARAEYARMEK